MSLPEGVPAGLVLGLAIVVLIETVRRVWGDDAADTTELLVVGGLVGAALGVLASAIVIVAAP